MNQEVKKCQNCKSEFVVEPEDFEFYEKMQVPAPTWCPDCRRKRRLSFYNVNSLKKRKCSKCQKDIFAIYPEGTEFPVYCQKCWWADDWGAEEYYLDYDFSKTFFEQFAELYKMVPRLNLETDYQKSVNSPFTNATGPMKNSYFTFQADTCENVMYSFNVEKLNYSLDCDSVSNSENCYQLFDCSNCYSTKFSSHCVDCVNVSFSENLRGCQDCFGCVNLRNKKYCFFNKQYSAEEYQKKVAEMAIDTFSGVMRVWEKFRQFSLQFPRKYMYGRKNQDVTGDYISNSKNVKESFGVIGGENIKYSQLLEMSPNKDCYDYSAWGQNAQSIYESVHTGENVNNLKFSNGSWVAYQSEYVDMCMSSNNLFGCIFLRHKQYCILNKQYSPEEYEQMVKKIKKQMDEQPYQDKLGRVYKYGEFFPLELSPFAYNETLAYEYFPITKEEALRQGYRWQDRESRGYQETISADALPDDIKSVDGSILKEVIGCATKKEDERVQNNCTEAFKVTAQELEFYQKHQIPLPRYCPNCRHSKRVKQKNPFYLYRRTCMKEGCNNEFQTTYAPERKEIVYCEECYNREVG